MNQITEAIREQLRIRSERLRIRRQKKAAAAAALNRNPETKYIMQAWAKSTLRPKHLTWSYSNRSMRRAARSRQQSLLTKNKGKQFAVAHEPPNQ